MKPSRPVHPDPAAVREARRSEALRQNLRRRKVPEAGAQPDPPGPEAAERPTPQAGD